MSATYTAGGVDPVSRLRAAGRDTSTTSPTFTDEDLYAMLDRARSSEHLAIYYPNDLGDGVTSAPVRVLMDSGTLKLTLQRVGLDGSADSIPLAPSDKPMVASLVDAIAALDKGWCVGLGSQGFNEPDRVYWIDPADPQWRRQFDDGTGRFVGYPIGAPSPMTPYDQAYYRLGAVPRDLANIALMLSAADLALFRQGTLDALGSADKYIALPFYRWADALYEMLGRAMATTAASAPYSRRKEGNVERESGGAGSLAKRLEWLEAKRQFGPFAQGVA